MSNDGQKVVYDAADRVALKLAQNGLPVTYEHFRLCCRAAAMAGVTELLRSNVPLSKVKEGRVA